MNMLKDLPIKGADTFFLNGAYLIEDPFDNKTYVQYAGHMIEQENMFHRVRLRFEEATTLYFHETDGPYFFSHWTQLHPEVVLAVIEEIEHPAKDMSIILKMEQIMDGSVAGMRMFMQSVRTWYAKQYFYDFGGIDEIDPDITFEQVLRSLADGRDVFEILGTSEIDIRAAVFKRLKQLLGCTYYPVYRLWLDNRK